MFAPDGSNSRCLNIKQFQAYAAVINNRVAVDGRHHAGHIHLREPKRPLPPATVYEGRPSPGSRFWHLKELSAHLTSKSNPYSTTRSYYT